MVGAVDPEALLPGGEVSEVVGKHFVCLLLVYSLIVLLSK